jgi:NhaA family Na+:H+ antiporter
MIDNLRKLNSSIKSTKLFNEFFESEKAGGITLVFVTALSLILANSPFADTYIGLWEFHLGTHSITHWISDGLMTIFFLLVGLELSREISQGELSDIKNASLPLLGALGGMLVPAGIYMALNVGTTAQSGAGIPMATDIAFAVGILSLLGNRVPLSLKVFLTALAVIDDLGAIVVIAVFYTTSLAWLNLGISLGIFVLLSILKRVLKVYVFWPYLIGGVFMWYFMLHSGVHATITGVLLAFTIPSASGKQGKKSAAYTLQHYLHKPVPFIIIPLFALSNTCIALGDSLQAGILQTSSLGIIAGLMIGKPLGISLFLYLGVKLGICSLPADVQWKHFIGAGILGGIGFTMSIFVTMLAFDDAAIIDNSKIAILVASCMSGIIGYVWLKLTLKPQ